MNILDQMLNKVSREQQVNTEQIIEIELSKLIRSSKNNYPLVEIEELAEDMEINGLYHNLVVRPLANGMFEIISGERRSLAAKLNYEQKGIERFRTLPCKINQLNDVDAELQLILANANIRERSEGIKLYEVQRLTELYNLKKAAGEKIPGKIRDLVASKLQLSSSMVGHYQNISKNLNEDLKEKIRDGKMTIQAGIEATKLDDVDQDQLSMIDDNLTIETVREFRQRHTLQETDVKAEEDIIPVRDTSNDDSPQDLNNLDADILDQEFENFEEKTITLMDSSTLEYWKTAKKYLFLIKTAGITANIDEIEIRINDFEEQIELLISKNIEKC